MIADDGCCMYYDEQNDILVVHNGFSSDESFETNMMYGDLIVDISTKGVIKGIELWNASEFLKSFGLTPLMLESLNAVELKTKDQLVELSFIIKNHELPILVKVALPEMVVH